MPTPATRPSSSARNTTCRSSFTQRSKFAAVLLASHLASTAGSPLIFFDAELRDGTRYDGHEVRHVAGLGQPGLMGAELGRPRRVYGGGLKRRFVRRGYVNGQRPSFGWLRRSCSLRAN